MEPVVLNQQGQQPVAELDAIGVPVLTPGQFARFRDLFYRRTGIHFDDGKRYFVDKRVLQRMAARGRQEGVDSYLSCLRSGRDADEWQLLINLLTVNETYFFREPYQFDCMVNHLLDEAATRSPSGRRLRIWSAPCSTGEEAYSIAIYLLERWPAIERLDVELLASDIDSVALSRAREGVYDRRSLQHLPPKYLCSHFRPAGGGRYRVSEQLRACVRFSQVNLANPSVLTAYRDIDLIFCRNMLIYFDTDSRRKTIEALYDALRPGGFICLGHSESMTRISPLFKVRRFPDAIVYQRPEEV